MSNDKPEPPSHTPLLRYLARCAYAPCTRLGLDWLIERS
jgi:hypothetical protein